MRRCGSASAETALLFPELVFDWLKKELRPEAEGDGKRLERDAPRVRDLSGFINLREPDFREVTSAVGLVDEAKRVLNCSVGRHALQQGELNRVKLVHMGL